METCSKVERIDKKIIDLKSYNSTGLADGKMGSVIYFFLIGRITQNKVYKKKAESLMRDISKDINNKKVFDIKTGLAGFGLGINYLIENKFMQGNINATLKDVDSILFREIYSTTPINNDLSFKLQLVYYFTERLKKQKKKSENEYFFKEVIINSINSLSDKINQYFSDEQIAFNMENPFILLLFVLSRCSEIYKDKIHKIFEEISYYVLSRIPFSHATRLYLLYAMDEVNKQTKIKGWEEHIKLLVRESDVNYIVEHELKNNVFFSNGITAIYFILSKLDSYYTSTQLNDYKKLIIQKIENATVWDNLLNDKDYLEPNHGLFSGYMGASLLLHKTWQR